MKVTLKDVAAECGIDISTVSRALRNDRRVRTSTAGRVAAAAARLGYQPNLSARNLAKGSTGTFWFLIPSLENPVERCPAVYAEEKFLEMDYDLLIAMHRGKKEIFGRLLTRLGQGAADGAVIIPGPRDAVECFEPIKRSGPPIVFLDRYIEGINAPIVMNDNKLAVITLIDKAREAGADCFAVNFSAGNPVAEARGNAAVAELKKAGIDYVRDEGAVSEALPKGKSLCVLDNSQNGVLAFFLKNYDRLKGRKLSFGVFDLWFGEPFPAEYGFVCIQDFREMAGIAVDHLLSLKKGETPKYPEITKVVPEKYIKIESRIPGNRSEIQILPEVPENISC